MMYKQVLSMAFSLIAITAILSSSVLASSDSEEDLLERASNSSKTDTSLSSDDNLSRIPKTDASWFFKHAKDFLIHPDLLLVFEDDSKNYLAKNVISPYTLGEMYIPALPKEILSKIFFYTLKISDKEFYQLPLTRLPHGRLEEQINTLKNQAKEFMVEQNNMGNKKQTVIQTLNVLSLINRQMHYNIKIYSIESALISFFNCRLNASNLNADYFNEGSSFFKNYNTFNNDNTNHQKKNDAIKKQINDLPLELSTRLQIGYLHHEPLIEPIRYFTGQFFLVPTLEKPEGIILVKDKHLKNGINHLYQILELGLTEKLIPLKQFEFLNHIISNNKDSKLYNTLIRLIKSVENGNISNPVYKYLIEGSDEFLIESLKNTTLSSVIENINDIDDVEDFNLKTLRLLNLVYQLSFSNISEHYDNLTTLMSHILHPAIAKISSNPKGPKAFHLEDNQRTIINLSKDYAVLKSTLIKWLISENCENQIMSAFLKNILLTDKYLENFVDVLGDNLNYTTSIEERIDLINLIVNSEKKHSLKTLPLIKYVLEKHFIDGIFLGKTSNATKLLMEMLENHGALAIEYFPDVKLLKDFLSNKTKESIIIIEKLEDIQNKTTLSFHLNEKVQLLIMKLKGDK